MKTENSILMRQARESLVGKWGLTIGVYVVFIVTTSALQAVPKAGPLLSLLITGPLTLGLTIFSLAIARGTEANFDQLFEGFKKLGTTIATYLLMTAFIILWSLLLLVPGIIASLAYSMTFFILADNPDISPREAIRRSKAMMDGNKWKFFLLGLRFLGWALLCILTLGIGFLWLAPYIMVTNAKFYEDLKRNPGVSTAPVQV